MLAYARRVLVDRPALWGPTAACALLGGLPGTLAATVLAAPLLALLLTGDPVLAFTLLPDPLTEAGSGVIAWTGVAIAGALTLAIWSRLYAMAVWTSDERNEPGIRRARAATASSYRTVFVLYLQALGLIGGVAAVLALVAILAGGGPTGFATVTVITAAAVVVTVRTIVRIFLTLAIRAAVLDGRRGHSAWQKARAVASERRREVTAAWIVLVALGASLWITGRLITPILQATAFDYPSGSVYSLTREAVQLAIAIPLEGFVLGLSIGVWTAVFVNPDAPRRPTTTAGRTDPWLLRGLAGVAVLALVANGAPTLIDDAWGRHQANVLAAIEKREISPLEALRSPGLPSRSSARTSYDVTAMLTNEHLEWSTRIDYTNDTGESLVDIGINVYPAAYERRVPEIPLASDLVAADLTGEFRAEARSGKLDVTRVAVNGTASVFALRDTSLTIELSEPLPPGDDVRLGIELEADLPHFPERFGVWRDTILLGNWIPAVAVREPGEWRLDRYGTIGDPFYAEVADYAVEIEADALLGIVGSGVLTGVEDAGGDRRRWNFAVPAARDAAFALGRFTRGLQTVVGSTTLRSWYPATQRERGADNLAAAASALADYTRRWGAPLYDEIDVVETEGMFGGMEYPGVVFVSAGTDSLEGVPLLPHLITHTGFDDAQARYVIGHEIAHQWWYAAVGSDQVKQPWLDEALAEVATRVWLRTTEGDDRTWRITNLIPSASPRDHVMSAAIDDYATNAAYTEDVYVSGAEVLMELRARIGAATFDAILAEWYERKTLERGTIEEFLDVVEEVGDVEAAGFLRAYR
jgi:hypothetical protein